jgi:GAF domain-containing protein
MFQAAPLQSADKAEQYAELAEQASGLLHGERDRIANAANFSALIYGALPELNWAGFYFYDGNELVVGPFQGRPACVRIALDKGVCGAAASTRETQVVRDVHAFPGHIACDAASRSEIVVPLVADGNLIGVFDVDSPALARFDDVDRVGMEQLVKIYVDSLRDSRN